MVFGPGHRPAQERRLPHRRRGGPRHPGARGPQLLRGAGRRRAARGVRGPPGAGGAGQAQVAGRQDRPGLLQEAGRRDPAARPEDASSTARRRSRASRRSAPPRGSTTSTSGCAGWWRGDDRAAGLRPHGALRDAGLFRRAASPRSPTTSSTSTAPCAGASAGSAGPFETWDALGVQADRREDAGRGHQGAGAGCRTGSAAGEDRFYQQGGPARLPQLRRTRRLRRGPGRTRGSISLDGRAGGGQGGRAQRQRLAAGHRRRRLLPGVPLQDERHRPRHRGDDEQGGRPGRARGRRRW